MRVCELCIFEPTIVQLAVNAGQVILLPALSHTELAGIGPGQGGGEHLVTLVTESVRGVPSRAVPLDPGRGRICRRSTQRLLTDKSSSTGAMLIIPFP